MVEKAASHNYCYIYDVQAVIVFTSPVEKDAARSSDMSTVSYNNTPQHEARASVDRQTAQTAAESRQAPQQQHAFHTYPASSTSSSSAPTCLSGTKAAMFLYSTTMNATVSVDTIYGLRLAQPSEKKGGNVAREARRFSCACIQSLSGVTWFSRASAPKWYTLGALGQITVQRK